MTRILLIQAGPTPWGDEGRLVGNSSLPLSPQAAADIKTLIDTHQGFVTCIYVDKTNEAAITVGKWLASRFKLRTRHLAELAEMNLGLWQGLDRPTLRTRFESSFPLWEENALAVTPPQGESLEHAIERLKKAVQKILKRNRGVTIALPLRPYAMQILIGILKSETPQQIAAHLHTRLPMETIEVSDDFK
jgi:broad specificity phosphatase PhoE